MSVDAQRDVRLGVPKALADGDNIDAGIDELAGVSVPQGMKDDKLSAADEAVPV